jgi:outer membrane protein assembly factor BamA
MPDTRKIFIIGLLLLNLVGSLCAQNKWTLNFFYQQPDSLTYTENERHKTFSDSIAVFDYLFEYMNIQQEKGFLSAGYDSIKSNNDTINAWFTQGRSFTWNKINIKVDSLINTNVFNLNKYTSKKLSLNGLNRLRERIINYYENVGYPFCFVVFDELYLVDNKLSATLVVNRGDYTVFDSLMIKGTTRTSERFLRAYLGWPVAKPYSEKYVSEINRNLSNLDFVEQGKAFELAFRNGNVDVLLYINDRRSSSFSGILGVLPNNAVSGKLVLTGDVDLSLKNVLGRGESFAFNWVKHEALSQQLELNLAYPYMFNTKLGTAVSFKLEKQDTAYFSTNIKTQLFYFTKGFDGLGVFYQNLNSYALSDISNSNISDVNTNLWGLSYNYRNIDYIFNPRKGFVISVNSGAGTKIAKMDDITDIKPDLQVRIDVNTAVYIPMWQFFTIKLNEQAAYIYDKDLFSNELYRIGGIKNLRGIDELSIKASTYSISSFEYRYLFEQNSALYLFSDFAWIKNSSLSLDNTDMYYGFGLGLDLFTKAGIFTINYAIAALSGSTPDFRTAKIHIGYKNRF